MEDSLKPGETTYCALTGDEAVFPENGPGRKLEEVSQSAVWLVEGKPGCWMDPNHDVPRQNALAGGVNQHENGVQSYRKVEKWLYTVGQLEDFVVELKVSEMTPEKMEKITYK